MTLEGITVSVVIHGHGAIILPLLDQLINIESVHEVILTMNIPEEIKTHLKIRIIENEKPKGFAENHNTAFKYCKTKFFAVVNPDIRIVGNAFELLLTCLEESGAALAAPQVINSGGELEDSIRRFPTLGGLLLKGLGLDDGRLEVSNTERFVPVPWVAGMFMLLEARDFDSIHGFDDRYFLYYEDVDLCVRLWRANLKVVLCPEAMVEHDARRESRKNARYARWHLASMIRYLVSQSWRLPRV